MKTAIVTFIRAYNHGAVLQCYALHKKLNELGIDNEVLDYYPAYFRKVYTIENYSKLRWFPGPLLMRVPRFVHMRQVLSKRNRGFCRFINERIRLSNKQYHNLEEIKEADFSYDAFIAGSDQVWSNLWTEFDPVYFLDFPSAKKTNRFSYAASFGFKSIPVQLLDEYKRRLEGWDGYSVREASGVDILADLAGIRATQCCDPTLLLTGAEWNEIANQPRLRKKYILVYYVNGCKKLLEQAAILAEQKGLQIISVTSICTHEHLVGSYSKMYHAKHFGACSPDKLLGLFSKAEYVLTDSFHGTVFSIMFHKSFLTLAEAGGRKNNRATELMDYLNLGERLLENGLGCINQEIVWECVDEKLMAYRAESLEYIQKIIDG